MFNPTKVLEDAVEEVLEEKLESELGIKATETEISPKEVKNELNLHRLLRQKAKVALAG